MKYENHTCKSASARLAQFCHLCNKDDFIIVTQWINGEGFDITIERKNDKQQFSLTDGDIAAINFLTKAMEGDID